MLHKHSFQHIAPAVKQQPIQQGAEGLSCCTHQSTCIPQRCPVQQQSETCIHKGSADTSNCLFLGSSYSGIACTTMSSMTAMLLPAAGSATVAGARGAAQSLLHRRTTTTSFHRSEQQEAPCRATPAAPPGKLPSRAAAGADLSWCACPLLAFRHSTREGAKQSMLMQAGAAGGMLW